MAVTSDLCTSSKFGPVFKNAVKATSASEIANNLNDKEMVMTKSKLN